MSLRAAGASSGIVMGRVLTNAGVDWTPYLIGVGVGVLSWLVFAVADDPLGITTPLTHVTAGAAALVLGSEWVAHNAYLSEHPFGLSYDVLFLLGVFLGGLVSALTKGQFRVEAVPSEWARRFGGSAPKRLVAAFVGGVIIMYGARLANGCSSGNGLSGGLQLAVSGWTFIAVVFSSAVVTAALIYRSR